MEALKARKNAIILINVLIEQPAKANSIAPIIEHWGWVKFRDKIVYVDDDVYVGLNGELFWFCFSELIPKKFTPNCVEPVKYKEILHLTVSHNYTIYALFFY